MMDKGTSQDLHYSLVEKLGTFPGSRDDPRYSGFSPSFVDYKYCTDDTYKDLLMSSSTTDT